MDQDAHEAIRLYAASCPAAEVCDECGALCCWSTCDGETTNNFVLDSASKRVGQLTFVLVHRSEEHTSELQSLMRISYAVFCLKKKIFNQLMKQVIILVVYGT